MSDQIQDMAQALKSTRSDLASLGQAVSSIVSYLFQNSSSSYTGQYHLRTTGGAADRIRDLSPPELVGIVRERLKGSISPPREFSNPGRVRKIFDDCATDKGYLHNYEEIYASIFGLMVSNPRILEIGTGAPESGYAGAPGGSLRAWRQIFPESDIFGVDIHPLGEKHLSTQSEGGTLKYICADQTSLSGMQRIAEELRENCGSLDLIIDDGLHAPHAVIPTVLACAPLMHNCSFYVIEDVPPSLLGTYLSIFELCELNMLWTPWKTAANNHPNAEGSYPGRDDRAGCAIVGIQAQ